MGNKDRPIHDLMGPCLSLRAKTEWDALLLMEIDLFNRKVVSRTYKAVQVIFL